MPNDKDLVKSLTGMPMKRRASGRSRLAEQIAAIPGIDFQGKRDDMSNAIYRQGLDSYTKGDMEGAARSWMKIPNHPEGRTALRRTLGQLRGRR